MPDSQLLRYLGAVQRGRASLRAERARLLARHEIGGAEVLLGVIRDLQRVAEVLVLKYLPDFDLEQDPALLEAIIEGVGQRGDVRSADPSGQTCMHGGARPSFVPGNAKVMPRDRRGGQRCLVCGTQFNPQKPSQSMCGIPCQLRAMNEGTSHRA